MLTHAELVVDCLVFSHFCCISHSKNDLKKDESMTISACICIVIGPNTFLFISRDVAKYLQPSACNFEFYVSVCTNHDNLSRTIWQHTNI